MVLENSAMILVNHDMVMSSTSDIILSSLSSRLRYTDSTLDSRRCSSCTNDALDANTGRMFTSPTKLILPSKVALPRFWTHVGASG